VVRVSDTTFTTCKCFRYGGALNILSATELTSCLFDRSIASGSGNTDPEGGGIHVDNANLTIISCRFISCNSLGGGGALAFSLPSFESGAVDITLRLENTVFLNCQSNGKTETCKGGALRLYFSGAICKNCSFLNCRSNQSGGAIGQLTLDDMGERTVKLESCIFGCNVASTRGGAIEGNWTNFDCANCSFLHNSAVKCGGAISCELRYNYTITATTFVRNFVSGCSNLAHDGGAIQINLTSTIGRFNLNSCVFITNYATGCGSYYSLVGNDIKTNNNLNLNNNISDCYSSSADRRV
jgi:predicted outer membrane repeat protein